MGRRTARDGARGGGAAARRYPRGRGIRAAERSLPYRPAPSAGLSSGQGAPGRADTRSSERAGQRHGPSRAHHPLRTTAQHARLARGAGRGRARCWSSSWRRARWRPPWPLRRRRPLPRSSTCRRRPSARAPRWPSCRPTCSRRADDLARAQAQLDEVTQRLQTARTNLARAQQDLDVQREILAKRAALLYKTGGFDWLDIISSLQSLADIDTLRSLQRDIADQDRKSENEAQQLARQARLLEKEVEKDREPAFAAEQKVQSRKIELDQALAERTAILQDVTKRIKKILASGGLGAALRMAKNGQFSQLTWAQALLVAMRFPVTADNIAAITAWEMAEGGHWYNTAYYNPLNTTQSMPGATVFNSVGVKAYTSWKQGLEATMITLKNGYYGGILDALKRGNDSAAVAQAVGASPWGTGDFSRLL